MESIPHTEKFPMHVPWEFGTYVIESEANVKPTLYVKRRCCRDFIFRFPCLLLSVDNPPVPCESLRGEFH